MCWKYEYILQLQVEKSRWVAWIRDESGEKRFSKWIESVERLLCGYCAVAVQHIEHVGVMRPWRFLPPVHSFWIMPVTIRCEFCRRQSACGCCKANVNKLNIHASRSCAFHLWRIYICILNGSSMERVQKSATENGSQQKNLNNR